MFQKLSKVVIVLRTPLCNKVLFILPHNSASKAEFLLEVCQIIAIYIKQNLDTELSSKPLLRGGGVAENALSHTAKKSLKKYKCLAV